MVEMEVMARKEIVVLMVVTAQLDVMAVREKRENQDVQDLMAEMGQLDDQAQRETREKLVNR